MIWLVAALTTVAGLPLVALAAPSASAAPATSAAPAGLAAGPATNEIQAENLLPGNPESEWQVTGSGDPTIQGYTTDISTNRGGTVSFKVDLDSTTPEFHIDIYRLGWYGGDGARKVATIPSSQTTSTDQAPCYDEATGLVDCGSWSVSATWSVPATAVSGIYIGRLVRDDTGGASHVPFVVRNDSGHSKLLFQTSDTTWQAYNTYGGNSLYKGTGIGTGGNADGRAYKVSYNRPITVRADTPEDSLFNAEYPMLRWLERNGYDTSYTTGVDTDRSGAELLEHQVFMSVGHDEYWSGQQRANVEAARDAGVHLAFFSGNEVFWKTRWESSIDGTGTPNRTLVSYKETHDYPNNADPTSTWTGTWRDPRDPDSVNQPENGLTGTIFTVNCCTYDMIVPDQAGATRLWRNSSVAASAGPDTLGSGILGYEWDEDLDNGSRPANEIRMSRSTHAVPAKVAPGDYGSTYSPGTATHSLTLHKAASGALVFGAGTVQWAWGLDDDHDRGSDPAIPAVQQATVNLLSDMGVSPATPQTDVVVTGPSSDTTAPTVTITAPTAGATVPAGTVTVQGTAADVGGAVGEVEVSADAGATWHPAEGWTTWSYSFASGPPGTARTVLVRAVDDSFNVGAASSVTFTVGPATCPCSIFGSDTPTAVAGNDGQPVEVGVKVRSDETGTLSGVRLYKATEDTITLTGHVWSATGTLLASTDPTSVTGSGWQVLPLTTPLGLDANTTYVVSYLSPSGDYASTVGGLATEVDDPPLRALADGAQGADGVYRYGGGFPVDGAGASNYWVDVAFTPGPIVDTIAPTIVGRTPAASATAVATGTTVTVAFSEAMDPSTIGAGTITLSDRQSVPVPASVSYDTGTRTAVLTPTSPLGNQADFTATVLGGVGGVKDLAGNPLATDATWSFRTIGPSPDVGPGGPIVVITNSTDPFSRYYAEILRAEGLNEFSMVDLGSLTAGSLGAYHEAILGRMALTPAQVTLLTNWVQAGGDLVAMAPDAQLASLLGIT
ncbi:MAG: N,N-dimethylformamidase beta subunit family domain-containing protein, partial [Acidimicrobiales bacterium]